MNFEEACKKIGEYVKSSNGAPIKLSSGEFFEVKTVRKYSQKELVELKKNNAISLPEKYRTFLIENGSTVAFRDKYGLGIEFHEIEKIAEFTESAFLEMENSYPQLFIFASILGRSDFVGFDLEKDTKSNLAVFFPRGKS